MAATLTADGELTFFSFPIEKSEETADGDVIVYGKATDGSVDSDLQIVDPDWSAKAIEDWLDTGGNLRVQHQARRDPAGKGLSLEHDPSGGTWVKALVVEPVAKELVKKGVLTCYSVGISHPDIVPDPTGKAMNGIIRGRRDGLTKISELSLVDRGSNFNSKFQLVKAAADDGHAEFVGKMMGETDLDAYAMVNSPKETKIKTTISIKPSDLAKLLDQKHGVEKRNFDAGVGGGVDRDKLPAEDFAGPNRTYPIVTPKDVHDAGTLIGHAADQDAVKNKIKAIARRKGPEFEARIPASWKTEDEPAVVKIEEKPADNAKPLEKKAKVICQGCGANHDKKHSFCPECGKKVAGGDPEVKKNHKFTCLGCNSDLDKGEKFCPGCGKKNPGFNELKKAVRAALKGDDMDDEKDDDTKPDSAAGDDGNEGASATDPDDESSDDDNDADSGKPNPADKVVDKPVVKKSKKAKKVTKATNGDTVTEAAHAEHVPPADDLPPHREPDGTVVAIFERDADMPSDTTGDKAAGLPPEMAVLNRFKSVGVSTDLGAIHDLTCPAYHPAETNKCFPYFDLTQLDDSAWQQKAFDLAASAPLAQAQQATRLWQHAVTLKNASPEDVLEIRNDLHKAFADANPGPGMAPSPTQLNPKKFNRPYLSAGHAAASPGQGAPNKAPMIGSDISAEDYTRQFLSAGHAADSPANKGTGVPTNVSYGNLNRENARQALVAMHDHISQSFPALCPMSDAASPAPKSVPPTVAVKEEAEPEAKKARRKKLEKAVLKGFLSLDDAKTLMGFDIAPIPGVPLAADRPAEVGKAEEPEVTKAAVLDAAAVQDIVTKAVAAAVAERDEAHLAAVTELQKTLKKQGKMLDSIAAQPDPVAPYRGVALMNSPQPGAEVVKSSAERSRENLAALLYEQARKDPNPAQREVAWAELNKMAFENTTYK